MGLDMYLYASKYVSNYDFSSDLDKKILKQVVAEAGMEHLLNKESTSVDVRLRVAYWRKANQIHNWFVHNVQDGEDQCQTSYVGHEQLRELVELCHKVLEYKSLAAELLPTTDGFFFGGKAYDDWYFRDLQDTIDQLTPLLDDSCKSYEFYYRASW